MNGFSFHKVLALAGGLLASMLPLASTAQPTFVTGAVGNAIQIAPGSAGNTGYIAPGLANFPRSAFTIHYAAKSNALLSASSLISYAVPGADNELLIFYPPAGSNLVLWLGGQSFPTSLPHVGFFTDWTWFTFS
jgi:hypothetical protein